MDISIKKILLVENHVHFAAAVEKEFLSKYTVKTVSNIADAMACIDSDHYDYYLVDYDLDDGKGDQFVCALKICQPNSTVIAISSHDFGNRSLVVAGADYVCSKMNFKSIGEYLRD